MFATHCMNANNIENIAIAISGLRNVNRGGVQGTDAMSDMTETIR